jgi:hypothetical protein
MTTAMHWKVRDMLEKTLSFSFIQFVTIKKNGVGNEITERRKYIIMF